MATVIRGKTGERQETRVTVGELRWNDDDIHEKVEITFSVFDGQEMCIVFEPDEELQLVVDIIDRIRKRRYPLPAQPQLQRPKVKRIKIGRPKSTQS
jgi:hypothetical protein